MSRTMVFVFIALFMTTSPVKSSDGYDAEKENEIMGLMLGGLVEAPSHMRYSAKVNLQEVLASCDLGRGAKALFELKDDYYDPQVEKLKEKLQTKKSYIESMQASSEREKLENYYSECIKHYHDITDGISNDYKITDQEFTKLIIVDFILDSIFKYNKIHSEENTTNACPDMRYWYIINYEENGEYDKSDILYKCDKMVELEDHDTIESKIWQSEDITYSIIDYVNKHYPFNKYSEIFKRKAEKNIYEFEVNEFCN